MKSKRMTRSQPFIHENFLFGTGAARELDHEYAAAEPILDYHCHLSVKDIADDRQFENLFEIWLEGDRYKWRAMRSNGIPEKFCTGLATPFEKFRAWASTVPHTLRNPLYHWTHLELKRCFGIEELLDEASAARIWNKANERLASPRMTAHGILKKFKIRALCTTDDPSDDLAHHEAIGDSGLATRVLPTFRPDKALALGDAVEFNKWITRLEATANRDISNLESFMTALRQRHDQFHAIGCRLSDHGLAYCYATLTSAKAAAAIFSKARHGRPVSPEDQARFGTFMMIFLPG